jgi:hypothetical protein
LAARALPAHKAVGELAGPSRSILAVEHPFIPGVEIVEIPLDRRAK